MQIGDRVTNKVIIGDGEGFRPGSIFGKITEIGRALNCTMTKSWEVKSYTVVWDNGDSFWYTHHSIRKA